MTSSNFIDLTNDSDEDGRQPRRRAQSPPSSHQYHRVNGPVSNGYEIAPLAHYHRGSSNTSALSLHFPQHMERPVSRLTGFSTTLPRVPTPNRPSFGRGEASSSGAGHFNHFVDLTSFDPQESLDSQLSHHYEEATVPTTSKSEVRVCINCASSEDVTCDGEQPCSACSEPGIDCRYPGDLSIVLPSESLPQASISGKDVEPEPFSDEGEGEVENISQFDLENVEGIRSLLRVHEARMRAHREYLTQPLLARAKRDAVNSSALEFTNLIGNPFSGLIERSRSPTTGNAQPINSFLEMRAYKPGAPKKWTRVTVPTILAKRDHTILPKYKSIGRLGATLLARNSYVKKYLPYFADEVPETERKREEDIAKWYQTDHDSMHRQRKCLEAVQLWKPVVEKFVSSLEIQLKDLLWYILNMEDDGRCRACDKQFKRNKYSQALDLLAKPDDRSLRRARIATELLNEVAKIHMWHIVVELDIVKHVSRALERSKAPSALLCSICFLHDCMAHGAYIEPSDEASGTFAFMGNDGSRRKPMMINDSERDVNERVTVAVKYTSNDGAHQCGLYCVDATTILKTILGRKSDGSVGGVYNRATQASRPTYDNFELCGPHCFWAIERRTRYITVANTKSFEPDLTMEEQKLFSKTLSLHASNQRVPCMLSQNVPSINCVEAFYFLLAKTQAPAHFAQAREDLQQQSLRKLSKITQGLDMSMASQLDERPPFIPCSHEGPCQNNPDCTCFGDKVFCEFFCGCDADCKRRFQGCNCAGKGKACFNDDRCECWAQNRECDPWVCRSCGAVEVLDPANKYREEIRKGRCKNTNIQLELPARTIKAPSEVQGWGLYAGQDLDTFNFIGEYKGEIVGNQESDRRGSIYHHLGQEYLFVTNCEQQIDGSNFGNKTRFINNSQRPDYINVLAKKLLCYGVQRVMLYAKRPIKAGDELLYNYNYPDAVTKTFWEKGEGPARVAGTVTAKPTLPTDGRIAKVADKQERELSEARSRAQFRHPGGHQKDRSMNGSSHSSVKRKRVSEGEFADAGGTVAAGHNDVHPGVGESEESEYQKDETTSDNEETNSAETSSAEDEQPVRQRRIHARDRRLGGNAQRKAWETRKNKARSFPEP